MLKPSMPDAFEKYRLNENYLAALSTLRGVYESLCRQLVIMRCGYIYSVQASIKGRQF
jgi:hypothetical protein